VKCFIYLSEYLFYERKINYVEQVKNHKRFLILVFKKFQILK